MIIHSNVEGDIEVYKLPVITEKKNSLDCSSDQRRKGFSTTIKRFCLLKSFCRWQGK